MDVREGVQGRKNSEAIVPEAGVWKQDGKKQETGKRWRLGWWHLGHHKAQVIQGSISQYFSIIVPSLTFLFLFNFIFVFNLFKLKKKFTYFFYPHHLPLTTTNQFCELGFSYIYVFFRFHI